MLGCIRKGEIPRRVNHHKDTKGGCIKISKKNKALSTLSVFISMAVMLAFLIGKGLRLFGCTLVGKDDWNSFVNGGFMRHNLGHHEKYNYGTPLPPFEGQTGRGGDKTLEVSAGFLRHNIIVEEYKSITPLPPIDKD